MDLRFPNSAANLDPADSCCGAPTISCLSRKSVATQGFLSGFRWTQILLNSVDFQMSYKTQNPPLATAYRFESGHRHQFLELANVVFSYICGFFFDFMQFFFSSFFLHFHQNGPPLLTFRWRDISSHPEKSRLSHLQKQP